MLRPSPPGPFLPLRGESSVREGGLGASWLLLQSEGRFGRDSAVCTAGGGVQLGCRAAAAVMSAACGFRVGEHLSGKAARHSQALCRVFARAERVPPGSQAFSRADECVCDSPAPSGELGVPVTHRSPCEGVLGKCPAAASTPLALLLDIPGSCVRSPRRWDRLPAPAARLSLPASCRHPGPGGLPGSSANASSGGG